MDSMDGDQDDCGDGKDSEDDGMIKVIDEIWLFITICSQTLNNDQSIYHYIRNTSVVLEVW